MRENVKTMDPQAHADYERAVDKIRDEMAKDGGRYVQVVGEFLTEYLRTHPGAAAAILKEDKTVKGSLGAMRDAARREQSGGVGILDDETAFRIVLGYYGIQADRPEPQAEDPAADDLSLDALLDGVGGVR